MSKNADSKWLGLSLLWYVPPLGHMQNAKFCNIRSGNFSPDNLVLGSPLIYNWLAICETILKGPYNQNPNLTPALDMTVDCFWFYGHLKIISLKSGQSLIGGGRKPEYPEKNHLTFRCRTWRLIWDLSQAQNYSDSRLRDLIIKSQHSY